MLVLKSLKLLIVDDHEDTRILLTFILEMEGAEVTAAVEAIEALAILDRSPFDVLISDIVMPVIDGYTFIKKVRACESVQVKSILAIALTARAGIESHQRAMLAGFHHCLFKPIDPDELVRAIVHLMHSAN